MTISRSTLTVMALSVGSLMFVLGCSDEAPANAAAGATGGNTGAGGGPTGGANQGGGGNFDGSGVVSGTSGVYLGSPRSTAAALFRAAGATGLDCSVDVDGDCVVTSCVLNGAGGGGAGGSPSYPTAGIVRITGGSRTAELIPEPDGTYANDNSSDTGLFVGGQAVTFSADGDDIPSFTEMVVAPSQVDVTAPDFSVSPLPIPTDEDLVVTWTNGVDGVTTVTLTAFSGTSTFGVSCAGPATRGTMTVPASALASLQGESNASLRVSTSSIFFVDVDNYFVQLSLGSTGAASGSSNGQAATSATFE